MRESAKRGGNFIFRTLFLSILFSALWNLQALAADQQLLVAAQGMINSGKPLDALDLLSPYEFEYAGEKEYDYLLGLSLLDSGQPGHSVFAFQRVLAIDPNFAGARMELARAYFDMSEFELSRAEFTTLQTLSPPANVQSTIDKYLAAIRNRTLRDKRGFSGYLQFGAGNDSNANSAPAVDSFLGFNLADESRETESPVISTVGGISYDLPVSYFRTYFVRSNLNQRSNSEASFSNTLSFDISAGIKQSFKDGDSTTLSLQTYSTQVDGSSNNTGYNLNGQYNLTFSSSNQVGIFARIGAIDYVESFDIKDSSQIVGGISWIHVLGVSSRPSLITTLIVGEDDPDLSTSPYARSFNGIRFTAAAALTHQLNLFASIGGTTSSYEGQFFGLPDDRDDDFSQLTLGVNWRFNKNWSFKALLNQSENASNIDLFDYEKTELMLIARSDFSQ
ncbi:MAG: tetratricopeptide repeat protein [Gammaproteobacteria bacterium]|nr:tetratricopeptide repeat protein [Gammaproteobacteria bacterium]